MSMTDISELNKCRLLLELARNCSNKLAASNAQRYTETDATYALLENGGYVDYFRGCPIKTDLLGNRTDFALYNRDNGEGKGEDIVRRMKGIMK